MVQNDRAIRLALPLLLIVLLPGLMPALQAVSTAVTITTLLLYNNTVVNSTYTGPVNEANWQLTSAVYAPDMGLTYALNPTEGSCRLQPIYPLVH